MIKYIKYLFLLGLSTLLISCGSVPPTPESPLFSKAKFELSDIYNDVGAIDKHGNLYSGKGLDQLRGMSVGRNIESNQISQTFLNFPKHEYKETSPAIPLTIYHNGVPMTSYSPACTTTYTGHIRIYQWKRDGKWQLFVVREMVGSHGNYWQGTNPPRGYYTSRAIWSEIR